ncbi:unnamed protein product, partial [Chrysoparadoxa australica]
ERAACSSHGQSLQDHKQGAVLGIASAPGGMLLTCGEDSSLALYCTSDPSEPPKQLRGHSKAVNRVVVGRKTLMAYSCSRDTTCCQWKLPETFGSGLSVQAPTQVYRGHSLTSSAVALSTDESHLCSGSRDTTVIVRDVGTGTLVAQAKTPRNLVTCLKYIPGEEVIAQGGEDLKLRLWDMRQEMGKPCQVIDNFTYFPLCVDTHADGIHLLTSSKGFNGVGCEGRLWDRRTGALVVEYKGHEQDATGCCFLPSGFANQKPSVVSVSKDSTVKVWDQATAELLIDHTESR